VTFNKGGGQQISATVPCLAAPLSLPFDIHAISVVETVFAIFNFCLHYDLN
jgi:hypothetical protein